MQNGAEAADETSDSELAFCLIDTKKRLPDNILKYADTVHHYLQGIACTSNINPAGGDNQFYILNQYCTLHQGCLVGPWAPTSGIAPAFPFCCCHWSPCAAPPSSSFCCLPPREWGGAALSVGPREPMTRRICGPCMVSVLMWYSLLCSRGWGWCMKGREGPAW